MDKYPKRLVVLDTHAILHRAYHALPDFSSSKGEPTGALYGLASMLMKIMTELKPDYIVAAYDLPQPTHRHIAYDKYKAHRPKAEEALVQQIIRSREVMDAFGIERYECGGFEADDILGTIAEKMKAQKDVQVIIASGDMDALQLVDDKRVMVYTLKKGLSDTIMYDEDAVKARFGFGPELIPDYKGLRGDPSDGIPGVKGIGEKTASALIQEFGTVENIYETLEKHPARLEEAGIKKGIIEKLTEQKEQAEMSKVLAQIHLAVPINFTLPQKEWRYSTNEAKALDMFDQFEFRSLIPRLRGLFSMHDADDAFAEMEEVERVDPEEMGKIGLAVSVLDSNIAEPELDDVYRMGRSRKFAEAKEVILAEIKEKDLAFIYEEVELPLMSVLRAMEKRGVLIDTAYLKELSVTYHRELDALAKRIYDVAGIVFNINSPKQLGEVLFDTLGIAVKNQKKTATGARSTRESELEKMKELHPIVADILAYRELQKLLSTYIDNLPTLLDDKSRVHTTFIQIGAATGRLATKNPGLQNIPIKTDLGRAIRNAFVAEEGMSLVSFDYSQIELRIAAFLSGDDALTDIFKRGGDVHTEVASRVFHIPQSEVSYEQRRRAKVINFGILYGMGVNALRESLGTTRAEAQEFYNEYFAAFPRLALYIDEVKVAAATLGYTKTFFGRRRYFDGIKSPIPFVRAAAERMAINAPMQGTQADIIKLAMTKIDAMLKEQNAYDRAHLLLQVHDELVFEIDHKKVDALAPKIKEIMEGIISQNETRGIPFIAEGKVGKNWGEMKKLDI